MFGIGMPELLIILVVALVVVGPKKLPDLAKSLGKGLQQFRKATDEIKEGLEEHESFQELKGLQQSFRETLDEVNPRKMLEDANPLVEPKEPKLDLSGRQSVFDAIEVEKQAASEQASVEVAQPAAEQPPAEKTSPQPTKTAEKEAQPPAAAGPKEA
ncbi:MAG: twin-arginine translocase subunit TatB [Desulfarculus sp.]|jgi:Tat protein translocase TatB subunit|nr:MAG: twin-arginine translocase subunit TatB [Desulfarculus sp.]